jgi:hypothetical protein
MPASCSHPPLAAWAGWNGRRTRIGTSAAIAHAVAGTEPPVHGHLTAGPHRSRPPPCARLNLPTDRGPPQIGAHLGTPRAAGLPVCRALRAPIQSVHSPPVAGEGSPGLDRYAVDRRAPPSDARAACLGPGRCGDCFGACKSGANALHASGPASHRGAPPTRSERSPYDPPRPLGGGREVSAHRFTGGRPPAADGRPSHARR